MKYKVTQKSNPSCTKVVDESEVILYKTNPIIKGKYHIEEVKEETPPEAKTRGRKKAKNK